MAHYGAKVLHPRALIPIAGTRIVLRRAVVHRPRPAGHGSVGATLGRRPTRSRRVAIVRGQAVVTVAGKGMVGVHGIAARTFAAVDCRAAVGVDDLPGLVRELDRLHAARSARPTARSRACGRRSATSSSGLIDNVTARPGMAVVAVVGDGMAGAPGIAARVFSALASGGINVVAIAQGSSERNISFVVDEPTATEAARRVHAAFQLSKIGGGRAPSRRRTPTSCCSASAASAARSPIRSPRRTAAGRCASSACSIARATSSSRAASRGGGCSNSRARRTAANCSRRSADARRRPPRR